MLKIKFNLNANIQNKTKNAGMGSIQKQTNQKLWNK